MDLGIAGKTALVLASSKGLGKAIAKKLSAEGAHVMLSSRNEEQLRATAEDIKKETNGKVSYYVCDITSSESIKKLVTETVNTFGTIDILLNNAGGPPSGDFKDFDDDAWQRAFELNLLSYVRTIREVVPYMKKQNGGRIVNIASSSFKEPIEGLILSNTFRTGVIGLAKSLATELGSDQILINTIGPGRIQTDRINELEQAVADQQGISREVLKEGLEATIPLGRYGTPEEFADVAVFLASFANSYVTGQAILIDGGKTKAL